MSKAALDAVLGAFNPRAQPPQSREAIQEKIRREDADYENERMAAAPRNDDRKVPLILRALGVRYFDGWKSGARTPWGEIAFGAGLIALTLDRKNLHLAIPGVQVFIRLPRWMRLKDAGDGMGGSSKQPDGSWYHSSREYGFSFRFGTDWGGATGHGSLAWNHRRASFSMPWGWNKRRGDYQREYLNDQGEWQPDDMKPQSWRNEGEPVGLDPWKQVYRYRYLTDGGELQESDATVTRERRTNQCRTGS